MKAKKRLLIALAFLVVLIGGLVIWMKQPAEITVQDEQKADEIAADEDLLNAIDAGLSGEDSTNQSTDSISQ